VRPNGHRGTDLVGRRTRALCGRGGTVERIYQQRPADVCSDCREIEEVLQ